MQQSPQPSLIPHEAPQTVLRRRDTGLGDLFVLVAIVLFIASSALAAGVFLYGRYLQSNIEFKVGQLTTAKEAFEPSLINELTRLDDRMRAASEVLKNHIAPTAFFKMLELSTISTVAFETLDFVAEDTQGMKITMEGVAASVNSIALQADYFAKGGVITSPIFSNINREDDGVHFDLSAVVDPTALNFLELASKAVSRAQLPVGTQQQPQQVPAPADGNQSAGGERQDDPFEETLEEAEDL